MATERPTKKDARYEILFKLAAGGMATVYVGRARGSMGMQLVYPETPDTFWSFKHALPFQGKRSAYPPLGLLTVSAYLLTLLAYALAPLGYSGAIREVSVVLGAFAGWRFLGEKMGPMRLAGAGIVFVGILMIALLG